MRLSSAQLELLDERLRSFQKDTLHCPDFFDRLPGLMTSLMGRLEVRYYGGPPDDSEDRGWANYLEKTNGDEERLRALLGHWKSKCIRYRMAIPPVETLVALCRWRNIE